MRKPIMMVLIFILLMFWSCAHRVATENSIDEKEKLFRSKCRSCHTLPDPVSRSEKEWGDLLKDHFSRIKLSEEDYRILLTYLQRNAKGRMEE